MGLLMDILFYIMYYRKHIMFQTIIFIILQEVVFIIKAMPQPVDLMLNFLEIITKTLTNSGKEHLRILKTYQ